MVECERLISCSADHVAPLWLFLILAGCRIGEALDLQIFDVQLDQSWAVVRDTKDGGRSRGIALHDQLIRMLGSVSVIGRREMCS
jgi:integrase